MKVQPTHFTYNLSSWAIPRGFHITVLTVQATLWISFMGYYGSHYSTPYSPDSCGTMIKSKFTVYLQIELITYCDKISGDNRQTHCNLRLE
jgi:hypothetical protein